MDVLDGIRARIKLLAKAAGGERELARRAKLKSETHLSLFLSGRTKDIEVGTLKLIAVGGKVSLGYLVTGRSDPAAELALDLTRHPHAVFATAAYAFLELYGLEERAVDVVRDLISASFDPSVAWSADDWFDALRGEYRRRRQQLSIVVRSGT